MRKKNRKRQRLDAVLRDQVIKNCQGQKLPELELIAKTDDAEPVGKILGFSDVDGLIIDADFKVGRKQ